MKNVTDRFLLKTIFESYYNDFCDFDESNKSRSTKNYVPIDLEKLSKELGMEPDLVFGRLYYHLEKKYGYSQSDGGNVHLFAMRVGGDHHVINFPMLSAVLAEMDQSYFRYIVPLGLSTVALVISVLSYFTS